MWNIEMEKCKFFSQRSGFMDRNIAGLEGKDCRWQKNFKKMLEFDKNGNLG